jgi:S-(hydroxymethyl)mycothiol dehydrogenase
MDRGIVAREPGLYGIEEIALEPPGPGEVLVRIEASGVCRSDLHVLETGWAHRFPVLLGHEAAGVVDELGEGVDGLRRGDRVILGWRSPCGRCPPCLAGDPRRCRRPPAARHRLHSGDGGELSQMLKLGTLATRTVVPASAAIPYPDALSAEHACLIGCCIATGIGSVTETARLARGARVAVIGCGAVGLSVVQGARLAGAAEIHAIDRDRERAEAARRFGATHTDRAEGLDAVFDVVGAPETFAIALQLLGQDGTLVSIGLPRPGAEASIDLQAFFDKRLRIVVSHGGDHLPAEDFPRYAALALSGEIDLAGLVTKTIELEEVAGAFADLAAGRGLRRVVIQTPP